MVRGDESEKGDTPKEAAPGADLLTSATSSYSQSQGHT